MCDALVQYFTLGFYLILTFGIVEDTSKVSCATNHIVASNLSDYISGDYVRALPALDTKSNTINERQKAFIRTSGLYTHTHNNRCNVVTDSYKSNNAGTYYSAALVLMRTLNYCYQAST